MAKGDEDLDIYFINGADFEASAGASMTTNRMLQQDHGKFTDVTTESGLDDAGYGMGVAVGDADNDGDLDVYVSNFGPDRWYLNDGGGKFTERAAAANISLDGWSTSVAFCDVDRDGWLDLFVVHYLEYELGSPCFDRAGRRDYCGPWAHPPRADVLLRNLGDGTFVDISESAGIPDHVGAGLGVIMEDFNADGWPDIYVANDGSANHLWINKADGTFREQAALWGVAYNLQGQPEAGMGVVARDFDGDEECDLFLTHLDVETNTLYRRDDANNFVDASAGSGLGYPSMSFTGFGIAAIDLELDGDVDLLVANGRVRNPTQLAIDPTAPFEQVYGQKNSGYLNDGHGGFVGNEALFADFAAPAEISRALAAGDLDQDGDLDVVISNIDGLARVYRNDAPRQGTWLLIRAVDPRLSRDALGARVHLRTNRRTHVATIQCSQGYLTSSPAVAHFGIPDDETAIDVAVEWPDGHKEQFKVAAVNQTLRLIRGTGETLP